MSRRLNPTRSRAILTALWMLFFLINGTLIISYGYAHDAHGIRYTEPGDAVACLPATVAIYSSYIGGMLALWFLRPFPKVRAAAWDRFRLALALCCSLAFNAFVTVNLSRGYLQPDSVTSLPALVSETASVAVRLSFLVGPVMAFYFGEK